LQKAKIAAFGSAYVNAVSVELPQAAVFCFGCSKAAKLINA